MKDGMFNSTLLCFVDRDHLSPHENILTIAFINSRYVYSMVWDDVAAKQILGNASFIFPNCTS